jgi:stress-induced morphogen
VVVVSDAFADKRLVARHRLINAALLDEDGTLGFHSLSIGAAKTPAEWGVSAEVPASPQCMGGDGSGLKR